MRSSEEGEMQHNNDWKEGNLARQRGGGEGRRRDRQKEMYVSTRSSSSISSSERKHAFLAGEQEETGSTEQKGPTTDFE
jgi:hypothetical protein